MLRHGLGHPASLFNVHKLYQDFRSQGLALSKDTLYSYVGYLEELFVVYALPVAERSLRKQAVNAKKLQAIDWALAYPFLEGHLIRCPIPAGVSAILPGSYG
jgi:predicted AAA+ superfamily ATPase